MKKDVKRWLLACALTILSGLAAAQTGNQLSGTLKKVRDTGTVTLGIRASSSPFSYLNAKGQPIGYSVDLCRAIVDEISNEIEGKTPLINYVVVTSESRIGDLVSGKIDLECGSTTNNLERQKQVAFSPVFFVAGTRILVRKSDPLKTFRDLKGKTVVATAGTTNAATMRKLNEQFGLNLTVLTAKDHAESFAMVANGKADAFALDDVLLYGLIAKNKAQAEFSVVGDFLSYDPYGIMFRKDDPEMAALVNRVFRNLAESRELEYSYNRWFLRKLPNGEHLNLPMSAQLREYFQVLGAPE
jgi:ABC-type amino acid transport substrate-binding protein